MSVSCIARRVSVCAGFVGLAAVSLSGCGGGGSTPIVPPTGSFTTPGTTPFVNANNASRGACTANAHQSGRARWTVLVYLNAASNLQPDSLINVAQMASVGSNADLNIVLQWKQTTSSAGFFGGVTPDTTPSFIGTRRYKLSKHSQADLNAIAPSGIDTNNALVGNTTVLDGDRLPDPPTDTLSDQGSPTADMGSYHTLQDFVQWGARNYPADHLAVVIWDHGSGALNVDNAGAARSAGLAARAASAKKSRGVLVSGTKGSGSSRTRGLSQDTQTGSQIATQELPLGLASPPQPIDMVVVDCSLQGTTEVAYDLRNSARIFVGTEESPPGAGYPYDAWLTYLQANAAGPCDSGNNLINDTIAAYPNEVNITQSMTDLSKMDAVASAVNAFGGSLRNHVADQTSLIFTARQNAQFFDFPEYKDLYDFADLIRISSGVPTDLATAAANVETSLWGTNGAILISQHGQASGQEAQASGLSIFLPGPNTQSQVDSTVGYDPQYANLGIAKAVPNWIAFLQSQRQ
jgi:hypothetical protein